MRTVDLERTIQAPITDVFDWLTDATNYQRTPLIRRVTLVRPGDVSEHGTGAVRLLVTPLMRLTEEIVEYDPPRLMRYKILRSVPPLRSQDGFLAFATEGGATRVHWHTQFEVAAPLLSPMWTLVLMPWVSVGIRSVLARADHELRR
ncbi:SRPBCC family protein [Nocardia pseudobrasiliensis]|uniref:Polyketide cyclase/dehydrase/lipid transport protein n=1 Tax=Nocardia pseudobrasiliensis TaxID=45979 RepID=A0A370IAY7_9NOCA|nr:SRPBCC family protein [Nocardia pseudobrasiliensis]RDI66564.1 polyketide cyclase/dehydrase/lipid transport protein [Nocardia pseudobrasiliensis]